MKFTKIWIIISVTVIILSSTGLTSCEEETEKTPPPKGGYIYITSYGFYYVCITDVNNNILMDKITLGKDNNFNKYDYTVYLDGYYKVYFKKFTPEYYDPSTGRFSYSDYYRPSTLDKYDSFKTIFVIEGKTNYVSL